VNKKHTLSIVVAVLAVASGCSSAPSAGENTGRDSLPIIGGAVDAQDRAVGMMQAWTGSTGASCTSTLIAPNVVLTAAHCVEDRTDETKAYVSFETTPVQDVTAPEWRAVKSISVHPLWGSSYINFGHDCAILVLEKPVDGIAPKAINTEALSASAKGENVRVIGYGVTAGQAQTGDGTRREIDTTLVDMVDGVIEVGQTGKTSCQGDSGGPTFATINGVEKQIGITSYGEEGCTNQGSMTRVDMCADWIKTFL
jgi:secreted trypsin-like serine protease